MNRCYSKNLYATRFEVNTDDHIRPVGFLSSVWISLTKIFDQSKLVATDNNEEVRPILTMWTTSVSLTDHRPNL